MKTKLLFFGMVLSMNLTFGQATSNQSITQVAPAIGNPNGANGLPLGPQLGSEIFRFRSVLVTQLDAGNAFDFTSSQWFAMGRLGGTVNGFNQTFYGLRFQIPNRSLLMGYTSASLNNPVIQWIGAGPNRGNLEFRSATAFGVQGTPATDILNATMTFDGRTIFGTSPNIPISSTVPAKVAILSSDVNANSTSTGLQIFSNGTQNSNGLIANASSGSQNNIAVKGIVDGIGAFEAAIYGDSETNTTNRWAGYFNGNVFISNILNPSDAKLKDNVKLEVSVLEKLAQLKPVTYNYKKITDLNLPIGTQHGFVAQELANVFPELTMDITKPVFDKENNQTSTFEFKSVNYTGLISVLTAGINELIGELKLLKEEIATLKENNNSKSKSDKTSDGKGFFMEQNIPNPFSDQTTIRFQLPNGNNNAEIIVFDMNGNLKKSYPINKNQNEITIKSYDIGKGLFIYSLIQNGQEILSKKKIVK